MKNILFLLCVFGFHHCFGQDTTKLYMSQTGYQKILVKTTIDTLILGLTPNGKLESKTKANPSNSYYKNERFYPNGNKMWEFSFFGLIQDGPSIFYNEQGKKLVTIHYAKGIPIDTINHSSKQTVLFGNFAYSSTVYGGVENEDGSSNVQEYASVAIFYKMKLVNYPFEDLKKPTNKLFTTTDFDGNFMFVVPRKNAKYGIFPDSFPDKLVTNGLACPPSQMTDIGSYNWNLSQEFSTEVTTSIIQTKLFSNSVGYAP